MNSLHFGDLSLIFKVTAGLNLSNLSNTDTFGRGTSV